MYIRHFAVIAGLAVLCPIEANADEPSVGGWEEITTGTRRKASRPMVYLGVLNPGQCTPIDLSRCDQWPNDISVALQRACRRVVVRYNEACGLLEEQLKKAQRRSRAGRGVDIMF